MTDQSTAKIDPRRVKEIFMDCLFQAGEPTNDYVGAEGIQSLVGFHPGRLAKHKEDIAAMLDELPDSFKKEGGGGMSFLSACEDKHGVQWTGFHQRMEQLFQLGIGIGKVTCLVPRDKWGSLPGGMPYYCVN